MAEVGGGVSRGQSGHTDCPPLVSRGRREPQVVPLPLWTGHRTLDILRDCDRCHGSWSPINNADTQHYKTRYIIHLPRQNVQHEVSNLEEIT